MLRILFFIFMLNSFPLAFSKEKNDFSSEKGKIVAPYGSWCSPISAETLAKGSVRIMEMHIDGDWTYLLLFRPENNGYGSIFRIGLNGEQEEVTPPDFNVKTSVHEYGGGAFTVSKGIVYASSGQDGKIYLFEQGKPARALTEGQKRVEHEGKIVFSGTRFADFLVTNRGLVAVGESHVPGEEVENFLALINVKTGSFEKLSSGFDFYSSPALSPDGKKLAWLSWNHPDMPWTHTELWVAEFTKDGKLEGQKRLAGEAQESIFQPQWSKEGMLYFVSDRESGWWNIFRISKGTVENICPMSAEIAVPAWSFAQSTYAFLGNQIVFAFNQDGYWNLGAVDLKTKKCTTLKQKISLLRDLRAGTNFVRFIEGFPDKNEAVLQMEKNVSEPLKTIYEIPTRIDSKYISEPTHIAYPSGDRCAYGFFYPPKNAKYKAASGEKPPLIVMIHGGPTAESTSTFQLSKQFWTTRGFAVLDVNYGGSTGYGRPYRELLNNNWGIVDVEDCVNGALYLAEKGLVDPNKMAIRGGSAGGYTTLAALVFSDVFKAGASYYGVADIELLQLETHKFESRYMEQLVGPYPQEKETWKARSPIYYADRIKAPLIIFQGEEDAVVPKNQSIMMYEALKKRGIPTELYIYPAEEHGFRQAKNIIHSLESELAFYLKVFGITPCRQ